MQQNDQTESLNDQTGSLSQTESLKCWTCQEQDLEIIEENGQEYYICSKCNPTYTIEECLDGCMYVCRDCRKAIPIGMDRDNECSQCGIVVCDDCVVDPYEDEDDDEAVFCSEECRTTHRQRTLDAYASKILNFKN
jgi:hypothetical protein